MTGQIPHGQATAGAFPGRRRLPARAARAGLAAAVAAVLALPALTAAGGTAMAAASAGRTPAEMHAAQAGAGRPATSGSTAAGTASKHVLGWGSDADGQLGDGRTTTSNDTPVAAKLPAGTKVKQVREGCFHTLALTSKGHVLAWGANSLGQLGDGTTTNSLTPVRVKLPSGTKVTAVRAGCFFSLALTSKGHVLAWGSNVDGQLGDGTTTGSDTPVRVKLPAGAQATGISAGENFGLARTAKGHVLAWGLNDNGQLGNASTANSSTPVRVGLPAGAVVTTMTTGGNFALAGTSGGGLFAWGANNFGQFGNGTTTSSDTPVEVFILVRGPSIGHLVSLAAGADHTLALFSSGALLAWGNNNVGELGNGTTTSSDTPVGVLLPAGARVKAIGAANFEGLALTVKGHVLTWGYGSSGQLGDGSTMSSDTPVRVDLPTGWRALAAGSGPDAATMLAIAAKKS
jgi:alpha-tubulin suppressor-like RCC1 family protein